MKAYPDYAETSFPWLPQIPAHWALVRNKNIFQEVKDVVGDNAEAYPLLSLTTNGIILRDITSGKGKFPQDFNAYKVVKKGDMAFCLFDMDETPRTVGLSSYDGMLTGAYTIFHVDNINPHYAYYYYLSLDNVKALRPLYSGLRKTISAGAFLSIKLPVPPRDEQDRIVRFLDWKVSLVNRLINLKRGEIKALDSLKRSMVNQAVTRGLSPDAPMKDSGAQWLGHIPKHWETQKIKYTFSERSEKGYPDEPLLVASQNMGVVPKNVYGNRTVEALKDLHLLKLVKRGDFVISLRSFQGGIELAHYQGIISPAYTVMIPNQRITEGYFRYLAKSHAFIQLLKLCVTGIREGQTIDYSKLKNHKMPLPPRDEQDRIVRFLDERTARLDSLTDTLTAEISTLAECKSKLISDVVTGKMDVRDVAIPAYDGRGAEEREH